MGATNIHYTTKKSLHKSPTEAFNTLVKEDREWYGLDPYNGSISNCYLVGEISIPETEEQYDEELNRLGKRECVYYETQNRYVFIGWAPC